MDAIIGKLLMKGKICGQQNKEAIIQNTAETEQY
jgi:hypothetical protein